MQEKASDKPGKRLALFFDGTWNDPADNTNVWRLHSLAAECNSADRVPQRKYYDPGVGTHWADRLTGGAVGYGLSQNVRQGYQWLMDQYERGDQVFLFGFSRGAFTARSLAGFIASCGLLKPGSPVSVPQLFDRYRLRKDALPRHKIDWEVEAGRQDQLSAEDLLLWKYSPRIPIRFIGVWDTVGALGPRWFRTWLYGRKSAYFHNTNLSVIVEHAYQALAVDEHRAEYKGILWTRFIPKNEEPSPLKTQVEQRWFIGAHANVGGGYRMDSVAQIPLCWMQQKAIDCGLHFRERVTVEGTEHKAQPKDSYAEFLAGIYCRLKRRYFRIIGRDRMRNALGFDEPINEVVDESVRQKYREDATYRPRNLIEWAKRKGVDLTRP